MACAEPQPAPCSSNLKANSIEIGRDESEGAALTLLQGHKVAAGTTHPLAVQGKHPSQPAWQSGAPPAQLIPSLPHPSPSPFLRLTSARSSCPHHCSRGCGDRSTGCATALGAELSRAWRRGSSQPGAPDPKSIAPCNCYHTAGKRHSISRAMAGGRQQGGSCCGDLEVTAPSHRADVVTLEEPHGGHFLAIEIAILVILFLHRASMEKNSMRARTPASCEGSW